MTIPPDQTMPRREPFFRLPGVVTASVAVLAAIHALLQFAGEPWQIWSLYAFAFDPARISGPEPFPAIPGSQAWTFLTYALLHGDWMHLIFNCLWFIVFGAVVARRLGAPRFLLLSAIAAIAGAIGSLLLHWGEDAIVVGASAAVSGVLAAAIPIMYGRGLPAEAQRGDISQAHVLSPAELLRDRRALFFMALWLAITLFSGATGWTGNSFADDFKIAWEAHLAGFLAGLPAFYWLDRASGLPHAQS
jgi:membrane associated rhomboid family serine protease